MIHGTTWIMIMQAVSINSASKEAWEPPATAFWGGEIDWFPLIPLQRKRGRNQHVLGTVATPKLQLWKFPLIPLQRKRGSLFRMIFLKELQR